MHPILFVIPHFNLLGLSFGPLPIYAYGAMLALAFLFSIALASHLGRKKGFTADHVLDLSFYVIIFSIAVARVGYIMTHFYEYQADTAGNMLWGMLKIHEGGLSFHGGVVGGALAVIYFCWRRGLRLWRFGDVIMPALALGLAMGRIGCFLNGCCYGRATNVPWAITFPALSDHIPRHPTQLYDMLFNFTIVLLLIFPLQRLKRKDGDIVAFWLILSGITRFIMEVFRYGQTTVPFWLGITVAQWVCVAMVVGGIVMYLLRFGTGEGDRAS